VFSLKQKLTFEFKFTKQKANKNVFKVKDFKSI